MKASVPSGETAMYSGSKSSAAVRSGKMRTPRPRRASSCPLKAVKSAVVTLALSTPPEMSIILTEPSGSTLSPGSPSLATNTLLPSGVKVTISGTTPTVTELRGLPSVSKKATVPGWVESSGSIAAARMPSLMAMLLIPSPKALISISETFVGF